MQIACSLRPGHLEKHQTFTVLAQRSAQTGNIDDHTCSSDSGRLYKWRGHVESSVYLWNGEPLQNTGDLIDARQRMFNAFSDFLELLGDTGRGELLRNIEVCNWIQALSSGNLSWEPVSCNSDKNTKSFLVHFHSAQLLPDWFGQLCFTEEKTQRRISNEKEKSKHWVFKASHNKALWIKKWTKLRLSKKYDRKSFRSVPTFVQQNTRRKKTQGMPR